MKEKESIKRLYAFTNQKEMVCTATLHEGSIPFLYNQLQKIFETTRTLREGPDPPSFYRSVALTWSCEDVN